MEGGTEETWGGGRRLLHCYFIHNEYYMTSVWHDAEVPWWDVSIKMSYSSHTDASNKNETETKVYKTKDPGGKHCPELTMPHKIWEFFCYIYCFSSPHLHTHILLCSWIVGWKQQVVCQSEHEQQHLLWTYNALGRVRIAFYRGRGRYFVLRVWKWFL